MEKEGQNLHEHRDFRALLQEELQARCQRNPGYSLRSFARNLGVDPSSLSKILNGKRGVTQRTLKNLGPRLGLSPKDINRFITTRRNRKPLPTGDFSDIAHETFQAISHWYHFAILELTALDNFKGDAKWIARNLGITPSEVNIAVKRMVRLGLLEISEDNKWIDRSGALTTTGNGFTNAAFRNLQTQIFKMGITAMEEVPMNLRDQSSITMAIDSSFLPKAKSMIRRFRRELLALMQSSDQKDAVFHLNVSLYPLTPLNGWKPGTRETCNEELN